MSNYIDNIVKNAVTYDLVSKPLANDIANEFSIQSTYAVGDYVMYDYKLYKCISAVTTAGNWNSAKWQECKIGDEINGGVKFTAQTLTSEQKAQARANIGAISQEEATPDAIRYSAQSLTDAQKNQARVNVGTVSSTSIADEFSTSTAYAVGDMVMYDSKLYKFKTAHSVGAWNVAQVDAVSVKEEISSLSNDLNELSWTDNASSYQTITGGDEYNGYCLKYNPRVLLTNDAFPKNVLSGWKFIAFGLNNPNGVTNPTSLSIVFGTDNGNISYSLSDLTSADGIINAINGGSAVEIENSPFLSAVSSYFAHAKAYGVSDGELQWRGSDGTSLIDNMFLIPIPQNAKTLSISWAPTSYNGLFNIWGKKEKIKWIDKAPTEWLNEGKPGQLLSRIQNPYEKGKTSLAYNGGSWLNSPFSITNDSDKEWGYVAITFKGNTQVSLTSLNVLFTTSNGTQAYTLKDFIKSPDSKRYILNSSAGGNAIGIEAVPYLQEYQSGNFSTFYLPNGDLQWHIKNSENQFIPLENAYLVPVPKGTFRIDIDWAPTTYELGFNIWNKINDGSESVKWVDEESLIGGKEISILLVGHSHTQDFISYAPYILKNYFPEVSFEFYMAYVGGATLKTLYTRFQNDTAFQSFYYAENSQSWTNGGSKTIDDILSTYTFDVVCMPTYLTDHQTSNSQDIEYWDMCANYIANNYTGGNPLKFIPLFQTTLRDNLSQYPMATQFSNTIAICKYILKNCVADDFIPMGMAVQMCVNNPTMVTLGDYGYFSVDGNHTQEGLPSMMQGFMAVAWILEKLGIQKSIYGCKARMTNAIYQTLNIPGPNLGTGVLTGTEEQNLLAQKIALKAIKAGKKFFNEAISDISYDGIDT